VPGRPGGATAEGCGRCAGRARSSARARAGERGTGPMSGRLIKGEARRSAAARPPTQAPQGSLQTHSTGPELSGARVFESRSGRSISTSQRVLLEQPGITERAAFPDGSEPRRRPRAVTCGIEVLAPLASRVGFGDVLDDPAGLPVRPRWRCRPAQASRRAALPRPWACGGPDGAPSPGAPH
jgi:hypothetical protein